MKSISFKEFPMKIQVSIVVVLLGLSGVAHGSFRWPKKQPRKSAPTLSDRHVVFPEGPFVVGRASSNGWSGSLETLQNSSVDHVVPYGVAVENSRLPDVQERALLDLLGQPLALKASVALKSNDTLVTGSVNKAIARNEQGAKDLARWMHIEGVRLELTGGTPEELLQHKQMQNQFVLTLRSMSNNTTLAADRSAFRVIEQYRGDKQDARLLARVGQKTAPKPKIDFSELDNALLSRVGALVDLNNNYMQQAEKSEFC